MKTILLAIKRTPRSRREFLIYVESATVVNSNLYIECRNGEQITIPNDPIITSAQLVTDQPETRNQVLTILKPLKPY